MPLLEGGDNCPFPPVEFNDYFTMLAEASIWYGGDASDLAKYYTIRTNKGPGSRFWNRAAKSARSVCLHLSFAADIARTSASLLFGESPKFRVPEAAEARQNAAQQAADEAQAQRDTITQSYGLPVMSSSSHTLESNDDAIACEERLNELIDLTDLQAKLIEAGEVQSGLGGVFLKVDYDINVCDYPILSIVQPDSALPEFKWGMLQAVTFFRTVQTTGKHVMRHLEYHDKTGVWHGLYLGSDDKLGNRIDLSQHPSTADLPGHIESDDINVVYVPNSLPNRRYRGLPYGQSDTANAIGLMEALDEAYTDWLRDIRLGAARMIVPEEYLDVNTLNGIGKITFDMEREIFSPLQYDAATENNKMMLVQPEIRGTEYLRTCTELMQRILSIAGYSMQTFGLGADANAGTASAAALRVKERRTLMTKGNKERYWTSALQFILYRLLVVDHEVFGTTIIPFEPAVEFGGSYSPDLLEVAQALDYLEKAKAASTQVKVETLHPDWEPEQVIEEVNRLTGIPEPPDMYVGVNQLEPNGSAQDAATLAKGIEN